MELEKSVDRDERRAGAHRTADGCVAHPGRQLAGEARARLDMHDRARATAGAPK